MFSDLEQVNLERGEEVNGWIGGWLGKHFEGKH